ncbi:MAG: hypothetical protein ACRCZI_10965 [Cetobacterium sp.]
MKLKNVAQLERLTAKEATVTDVLEQLTKAVADQAEVIQEAFTEQSRVLKELAVASKMHGPIAVTVEAPQQRPRRWVAVIERDKRSLMSRVVITANEGA